MRSLREGSDLYAAGLARQVAARAQGQSCFTYLYPPLTLFILRFCNLIPSLPGRIAYWLLYAVGFGGQLWAGWQLADRRERRVLRYLLPVAVFFPGLVPAETILSGNVAIPLYGAAWAAAVLGWKQQRWGWFYVAVLAASLFKPPMLTLLAIPLLAGHKQMLNTAATAMGAIGLFAAQLLLWPKLAHGYLLNVQMEFTLNHGFGRGPAGVLGSLLWAMNRPFNTACILFSLCFGVLLLALLLMLQRRALEGQNFCTNPMALLLTGTILLNPRVMFYDALAATVPMMLLVIGAWHSLAGKAMLGASAAALLAAYIAGQDNIGDALLMLGIFVTGVVTSLAVEQEEPSPAEVAAEAAAD